MARTSGFVPRSSDMQTKKNGQPKDFSTKKSWMLSHHVVFRGDRQRTAKSAYCLSSPPIRLSGTLTYHGRGDQPRIRHLFRERTQRPPSHSCIPQISSPISPNHPLDEPSSSALAEPSRSVASQANLTNDKIGGARGDSLGLRIEGPGVNAEHVLPQPDALNILGVSATRMKGR